MQARVADQSSQAGQYSSELVGELARQLSVLVRRDIEVAGAERLPTLRRALLDAGAVAAVAIAALFALAAVTVAAARALSVAMPAWAAALLVAAAWSMVALVVALLLLRPRAQPREREQLVSLLQLLSRDHHLDGLRRSREDARDEAEQEMRRTASQLVKTLLDEAAEHQVKALPQLAKREGAKAESDAAELIAETLSVLTAPARAGWHALERLVEPPPAAVQRPHAPKDGSQSRNKAT